MKPSRKKTQEGSDDGRSSSGTRPRNSTRICLDGTHGRDVVPSYQAGILSIFSWCRANGFVMDVSSIFGPGVEVVTTPPSGTFHLELEYSERRVEVVINGRDLYVMGWRSPNGSFEIQEEPSKTPKSKKKSEEPMRNYMPGQDVRPVYCGFNYRDLAPNGKVSDTMMGIYEFRRAFDALFQYKGGSPGRDVREAVGKIAVFISEATRFPFVEDTTCSSFTDGSVSRLSQAQHDVQWLQRWGRCSAAVMEHIDSVRAGRTPKSFRIRGLKIQSAADIVPMIRVLYIDAYSEGKFAHDPPPKVKSEEPVDPPPNGRGQEQDRRKALSQPQKEWEESNKEATRGPTVSASSFRSSTQRRYCSSPSLDSWWQSVEENKGACKSLSKGCGGSTLSHLGAAPVSSSVSSAPPSALSQQDTWRKCVDANGSARNFMESLSSGCGRRALMRLAPQASESERSKHFPALRKLCGLSYEMGRRWRTPIHSSAATTSASALQYCGQSLRTTFAKLFKAKRSSKTRLWSTTQLLQTGSETEFRQMQKGPIQRAGVWISRVLGLLRR